MQTPVPFCVTRKAKVFFLRRKTVWVFSTIHGGEQCFNKCLLLRLPCSYKTFKRVHEIHLACKNDSTAWRVGLLICSQEPMFKKKAISSPSRILSGRKSAYKLHQAFYLEFATARPPCFLWGRIPHFKGLTSDRTRWIFVEQMGVFLG